MIFYDVQCSTLAMQKVQDEGKLEEKESGVEYLKNTHEWTDPDKAWDLMVDIAGDCDEDCLE